MSLRFHSNGWMACNCLDIWFSYNLTCSPSSPIYGPFYHVLVTQNCSVVSFARIHCFRTSLNCLGISVCHVCSGDVLFINTDLVLLILAVLTYFHTSVMFNSWHQVFWKLVEAMKSYGRTMSSSPFIKSSFWISFSHLQRHIIFSLPSWMSNSLYQVCFMPQVHRMEVEAIVSALSTPFLPN